MNEIEKQKCLSVLEAMPSHIFDRFQLWINIYNDLLDAIEPFEGTSNVTVEGVVKAVLPVVEKYYQPPELECAVDMDGDSVARFSIKPKETFTHDGTTFQVKRLRAWRDDNGCLHCEGKRVDSIGGGWDGKWLCRTCFNKVCAGPSLDTTIGACANAWLAENPKARTIVKCPNCGSASITIYSGSNDCHCHYCNCKFSPDYQTSVDK
jgi:hypothetical protein